MLSSQRFIGSTLHIARRGILTLNTSSRREYICTLKANSASSDLRKLLCRRGQQIKRNLSNKPSSNTSPIKKESLHNEPSSIHSSSQVTFLQRWLAHKEIPPRGTLKWYGEMILICTVFAITGTSTMVIVRPAVSNVLGLEGSLKDGPWSYRICSLVIMTPLYSAMLVVVGTVFGRHAYFRHFAVKMFSRFGIPPELMDKNFHQTAKNFRKY
mmetsp:Transcript_15459/g.29169  ORF Transcript_15459/g.29169 Transcript_15459/m.29169 type:complete len:212 (-) Transcript_15459:179-814(-)